MGKKESEEKYIGKWLLRNKDNKVVFFSSSLTKVVEEGRKYKLDEVTIDKKLLEGTCFF